MPYILFVVMFFVSLLTALSMSYAFVPWINRILERMASKPLVGACNKCLRWALVLVGLQSGVRWWELEKYLLATHPPLTFGSNPMHGLLTIYHSFIDAAQSCIWVIVLFLLAAFIAEALIKALGHLQKTDE